MMGSIIIPPGAQTEPGMGRLVTVPSRHLPPRILHYLGMSASAAVSWEHDPRGHVTKSEYQELAEFIALRFDRNDKRFDAIDERFDAIERRFDAMDRRFERNDTRFDVIEDRLAAHDKRFDSFDERLHRVEILGEQNLHQIQIVAEAVTGLDQRFEAFRSEMAEGFEELRNLIRTTYVELDRRVTRLEEDQRN